LSGEKAWIGTASWAGVINIFVQALDRERRPLGITGFVLRQGTPGLRQGPEALTLGMRGMVQNSIYLDDVRVGAEHLLGEVGGGMEVAQDAMMLGRLGIAAMCVGAMKRCAQLMLRYSERRTVATGRLLDNPVTLSRLSELTAATVAVEALVDVVNTALDAAVTVPVEIYAACKTSGPEFLWTGADQLVQLLGARGCTETNLVSQVLRDARVAPEGPTTLHMFLGSRVLAIARVHEFIDEQLGAVEVDELTPQRGPSVTASAPPGRSSRPCERDQLRTSARARSRCRAAAAPASPRARGDARNRARVDVGEAALRSNAPGHFAAGDGAAVFRMPMRCSAWCAITLVDRRHRQTLMGVQWLIHCSSASARASLWPKRHDRPPELRTAARRPAVRAPVNGAVDSIQA
jgi:hypothetical protein